MRTTSPSCRTGCRSTDAWCGAARRSASGRWSGCECVTRTTPNGLPASRLPIASRCASSSGPGSITATAVPASTSQVFVPGPVYGPGFGATMRVTCATSPSAHGVRGQVYVHPARSACVEPPVQVSVHDHAHEGLPHLGHGERLRLAARPELDLPPRPDGLRGNRKAVSVEPVAKPRERFDEHRLRAEDDRLGGHVAR